MTPTPQPNEPQRPSPAMSSRPGLPPQLPPSPAAPALQPAPTTAPGGSSKGWRLGLLAAAAAAITAVGLQLFSASATESNHPNWQQVREASARPPGQIRWQNADGTVAFLTAVPFSIADRDDKTTDAVREALEAGDDAKAAQIIAAAQTSGPTPPPFLQPSATTAPTPIPATPPTPAVAPAKVPVLTDGLKKEILRGDTQFFHLYLYDCCDEDGDVVDVLLNGKLFHTVKLTNRGATISIPVSSEGSTKIELRGAYDGGGGITVGCRSSRGHGFLRVMDVGETLFLDTVRK